VRFVVIQPRAGRLFERDYTGNFKVVTVGLSPRVNLHRFRHNAARRSLSQAVEERDLTHIAPGVSL
jgi:hypothetical protein